MTEYITVSMCQDCKLIFPNDAMKVEGDYKQHIHNKTSDAHGCAIKVTCPECGREIETYFDNLYWSRVG